MSELYRTIKYDKLIDDPGTLAYHVKVAGKWTWLPRSQVVVYKVPREIELPGWLYNKKFSPDGRPL